MVSDEAAAAFVRHGKSLCASSKQQRNSSAAA